MLRKKGGTLHFCFDYHQANAIREDIVSHLPNLHEILQKLGTIQISTMLNLKYGYWQISIEAATSRPYNAFSIPDENS